MFFYGQTFHGSTKSPDSLEIDKAVCIVVPLILIAATPVGAIKTTVGLYGFIVSYLKVLTALL